MKNVFLLMLFLTITVSGWACDSYEECLKSSRFHMESSAVDNFAEQAQAEALQAIAYKLDEISKLMKEKNG